MVEIRVFFKSRHRRNSLAAPAAKLSPGNAGNLSLRSRNSLYHLRQRAIDDIPTLQRGCKPRRVFHLPLRGRDNFAYRRENFCFAERISHFVGENFFLLRKNREAPKPFGFGASFTLAAIYSRGTCRPTRRPRARRAASQTAAAVCPRSAGVRARGAGPKQSG